MTAHLGSNWNNGTRDGSFYWNVNNAVGNRNRNIGGRLALNLYFKNKTSEKVEALPLGKTQKMGTQCE